MPDESFAARVCWISTGIADALIADERESALGNINALTEVTTPSVTTICTWTLPYLLAAYVSPERVFVEITGATDFVTLAVGAGLVVVAVAVGAGLVVALDFGIGVSLVLIVGRGEGDISAIGSVSADLSKDAGVTNSVGGDTTRTNAVPVIKPSSDRNRYLNIATP
jgi:hypothetical protein